MDTNPYDSKEILNGRETDKKLLIGKMINNATGCFRLESFPKSIGFRLGKPVAVAAGFVRLGHARLLSLGILAWFPSAKSSSFGALCTNHVRHTVKSTFHSILAVHAEKMLPRKTLGKLLGFGGFLFYNTVLTRHVVRLPHAEDSPGEPAYQATAGRAAALAQP